MIAVVSLSQEDALMAVAGFVNVRIVELQVFALN